MTGILFCDILFMELLMVLEPYKRAVKSGSLTAFSYCLDGVPVMVPLDFLVIDPCVDHRGGNLRMTEQFLYVFDRASIPQQRCCKRMTEAVRSDLLCDSGTFYNVVDSHLNGFFV